ncbi:MAG: ABC transporter ATP-binding protein [Anaerolineaceae bacterium]|nr:ABC transporter ATP-binding protein [Anaerolineaceae bacterium]
MESAIKAENLTKRYTSKNRAPAIEDVSFAIPQGILYGLVGPDGAGKTTILRILSSVMNTTSGNAWVSGFNVRNQAEEVRRHLGYMPQNFSLYPDLNIMENLNFFADIQHVPAAEKQQRIEEMLSITQLEKFTKRRAGNLSGGMKKKLALACAMVHNPRVLILDEPSTGVDPVSRRELWVLLARVVQNGVTVLVSTPYMDEAERCHQVGILYQGKILTSGSPEALTSNLPFEILEVKAKPRKLMRQIISESDDVLDWNPVGDRIRVLVSGNGASEKALRSLKVQLKQSKAEIITLRHTRRTMEDAFVHLVKQQRGAL